MGAGLASSGTMSRIDTEWPRLSRSCSRTGQHTVQVEGIVRHPMRRSCAWQKPKPSAPKRHDPQQAALQWSPDTRPLHSRGKGCLVQAGRDKHNSNNKLGDSRVLVAMDGQRLEFKILRLATKAVVKKDPDSFPRAHSQQRVAEDHETDCLLP